MEKQAYEPKYGEVTHRAGASKGIIHQIFDKDGRDAAIKAGLTKTHGLKETTLKTWTATWAREAKLAKEGRTGGKAAKAKAAPARTKAVAGKTSAKKPATKVARKRGAGKAKAAKASAAE
jgi:hypothetical protein